MSITDDEFFFFFDNQATNPLTRDFYLSSGTYYVDSVNGDDGNAGTSADAPLATLGAIPSLSANDVVSIACGSVINDKLSETPAVNGLKFGAYVPPQTGNTTKPILDGSASIATGAWSKTGGLTNVYQATLTIDSEASAFLLMFEDDGFMTKVADTATCDSTPNSYTLNGVTEASKTSITVYIHATGSTNPATNGSTYEHTKTTLMLNLFSVENCVLFDLEVNRSLYQNGGVYTGRHATVKSCDFKQGSRHNFITRAGTHLSEDCTYQDGYYANAGLTLFVAFENTGTSADNITLRRCTASSTNSPDTNVTGFLCHDSGAGQLGSATYIDCVVQDVATGISFTDTSTLSVSGTSMTGVSSGIGISEVNATATITTTDIDYAASGVSVSSGQDVTISGCTFNLNDTIGNGGVYVTGTGAEVAISGSTFTSDFPTEDGCRGIRAVFGGTNVLTILDNCFDMRRPIMMQDATSTIDTSDNNTFTTNCVIWTYQNTGYSPNLAGWQVTGFDANSVTGVCA